MKLRYLALAFVGTLACTPVLASSTQPSVQDGEQLYGRCLACHAIEANRTGPQHCGLFGRRAGTAPGYNTYSAAMKNSGITWDEHSLDVFLEDPMKRVPGTIMGYAGIKDAKERHRLIAWLREATKPGQTCRLSK